LADKRNDLMVDID